MNTKEIGALGETAAENYLRSKGYNIVDKNFTLRTAEIDIIAEKGECTVFIEVKTRKNNIYGEPSQYVDYRKQNKIRRAALAFVRSEEFEMRFDVIEVFYKMEYGDFVVTKINHIENAF